MLDNINPSREIDARIHERFRGFVLRLGAGPVAEGLPVPAYTSSIDAIVGLVRETLPGWVWRLCECHVADDAWIFPDAGHPEHGEMINRIFPDMKDPLGPDAPGLDLSATPAGRPALLLSAILVEICASLDEDRIPSENLDAFHDLIKDVRPDIVKFDLESCFARKINEVNDIPDLA